MTEESLTELIGDFEDTDLEITIKQKDLETTIKARKKGPVIISAYNIALTYDKRRFEENATFYVAEQLIAHQNYHELISRELSSEYTDIHEMSIKQNDIDRDLNFIPENTIRPIVEIAKLLIAPKSWIKFKTLRGDLKEKIRSKIHNSSEYKIIQSAIGCGERFINRLIAEPNELAEPVMDDLERWKNMQIKIGYVYSRLVATTEKKVEVGRRWYKFMFPGAEDPLK